MAHIFSRTLAVAIALLAPAAAALAAPLAACPPRQSRAVLDGASVFDGLPEKQAELLPDFATLEWDLAAGQEGARGRGESLYLVCKYRGGKSTVTVKLAPEATLCKAEGIRNRMVVSCRAAAKDSGITQTKE